MPFELDETWRPVVISIAAVAVAWLISRLSRRSAERLSLYRERRLAAADREADTGAIVSMKRYETTVSLIHTTIRYVAFTIAAAIVLFQLAGPTRTTAVLGGTLIVLLIGFAAQRFMTDILAGTFMFFEGWFAVGDTVTIEPLGLSGVVEEVSLRSTTLRAVTGETIRVHNSQILATRTLPRGMRDAEIELFVHDEDAGRELIEELAQIVPAGPTRFVRRPVVESVERLDDDLYRITSKASVAHGRDWLVNDFLPDLVKERAEDGLVVHGPVVMFSDERASRRFARTARVR